MTIQAFRHTGSIGDVWASIPTMKTYYEKTGKKIDLYLVKDVRAEYYDGATHPTRDISGNQVMLNDAMIEMMIPLFKSQDFINECKAWDGEDLPFVNLALIRESYVGMPSFSINRWYFYIFPDLACDLSKVWLNVPDGENDATKGKIVITRSERYTNERIDYSFLKPYEEDIVFIGTMREYNNFCMRYDLNIKKVNVRDFLEMAQLIKTCKFHITNQTQAFQLSEGQKVPRILELCSFAPNCIPIGENAYDFFAQQALEYYFHKLNGTLEQYMNKVVEENK